MNTTSANAALCPLNCVPEGQTVRVRELLSTGSMRRRLLDIGLIEGTDVACLQKSPAGDPVAYLIRGAVIAIRSEEMCIRDRPERDRNRCTAHPSAAYPWPYAPAGG